MRKKIVLYGCVLAVLSVSLKVLEYKLVIINHALELYGGVLAMVFAGIGIYMGKKITGTREVLVEKVVMVEVPATPQHSEPATGRENFEADNKNIDQLGISKREYEILELMAQGCSNQEIAEKAFVSLSTVKTHVSNLFVKLDVQRRTQAIKKAKDLRLIP